ncbi:MAG: GNAT family N-acetyltransferase [Ruminococcaceae bacterium]|nr:GNAT family N-acetyltransferase [Oscillospiraceae bacterium]
MTITLRAWQPDDAANLARIINNPNILNNLRDDLPYPYTTADATDYIQMALAADPAMQYARAIVANGAVVGSLGIFRQQNIHRLTAELGYYVAEPWWGKGVCTKAVSDACAAIFATTDIVRIFAEPFSANKASCRVLEKAGFLREGTLRKNAIKHGALLDMEMYALVKKHLASKQTPYTLP